jgi:iron(III) transport system ATP-binding protein
MKKVSVQCRGLRLAYGATEVLKGVSLDIAPGEFFALLGPSGSGKSTLLRALAGFARHHSGQLLIDGEDVSAREPWQRQVGLVFQNYALWPHLSVRDNVGFGLVERRVPAAEIRRRVDEALERVDLAGYAERAPNQLSGGQQQRVALARTLVIEPKVLLLDEPLSNLDKSLRVQMRQELLALQRRLGLTTIFVTHDQEEAMTTADRMAVLDQGVLQQVGTPMQLYDEPVNAFVAGFVGTMNLLPVTVTTAGAAGATVALAGGDPSPAALHVPGAHALATGAAAHLGCRPHTLRLQPVDAPRDPECGWLNGVVQASEFLGEFTRYRVQAGAWALQADQPHRAGQPRLPTGAAVAVGLDPTQARLLVG